VNVTVTPLAAVPLDVTAATSMSAKASPTFAFCPDPLVAVIARVGGGVVLELLLQPVRNPKARQIKIDARMLLRLRFIASPLSQRRVHGLVATLQSRAHCAWYPRPFIVELHSLIDCYLDLTHRILDI